MAQHVSDRPFRDLTVGEFIDLLASSEPVPGGGSAAAIAASLGAGLVAMVATLSQGRPRYAQHADLLERAVGHGSELADRFLAIADDDAAAYAAFGAALRLPRETDDDRFARTRAMQAAARTAVEVPLRCMEACLELASTAEELAGRCNVNAASDLNVAALLAEAAARGAAENVRINLPSLGDEQFAAEAAGRADTLLAETARLAAKVRDVVASGAARPALTAHSMA